MKIKFVIDLYSKQNVSVFGKKGSGKDMLSANVIVRRDLPYVSNVDYGGKFFPFEAEKLDCGRNTYENFLSGNVNYYSFPYPDRTDIYISDAGVYFPAQFCNELNKKYPYLPSFFALGRHVGESSFHVNSQALQRVYDKIREQAEIYIYCKSCIVIFGYVFQRITIYDKYESALARQRPLFLPMPLISNKETRMMRKIQLAQYEAAHGMIKNGFLIYRNKSNYNTRVFKEILEGGKK